LAETRKQLIWPSAPGLVQGGAHRRVILMQAGGEIGKAGLGGLAHPKKSYPSN